MATIADLSVHIGVEGNLDQGLKQAAKSVGDLGRDVEKTSGRYTDASGRMREANGKFAASAKTTGSEASRSFKGIESALGGVSGALAGALTVGALLQFGSAVVQTTANFQKMEAVLTNTLGSSSAAQNAMLMIQDIAATTPFSVEQLTESFVKLANRGIVPTSDQITKLGDLAASTGKDFDQLTEAMLDAMTGEFERLKEFGVIASSQGDKVAFTFKGVTTEVAKTDTAIKDYILSLGETQGVTGSMAAISDTLGGKISNLGDSFDQLFLTIGNGNKGILASSIDGLNTYIQKITTAVKSVDQLRSEVVAKSTKDYLGVVGNPKNLQEFAEAQAFLNDKTNQYKVALSGAEKELSRLRESNIQNLMGGSNAEAIEKQLKVVAGFKREMEAVGKALSQVKEGKVKFLTPEEVKPQITTLETLKAKLKGLQDQQETLNVSDTKGLITKNQEIKKLEDLIKKYEQLGTAKGKSGSGLSQIAAPNLSNVKPIQDFGSLPESSDYDSITNSITQQNAALAQQHAILGMMPPAYMALGQTIGELVTPEMMRVQEVSAQLGAFWMDNLGPAIEGLSGAFASLFSGDGGAGDFFKKILGMAATFAIQYGGIMIALGAAKNAALPGSGVADMVAGKVLIAVASAAKGVMGAIGGGGGGRGGISSGNSSYSSPTNRARTDSFSNGAVPQIQITGEARVAGSDIIISYERAQAQNNRRG